MNLDLSFYDMCDLMKDCDEKDVIEAIVNITLGRVKFQEHVLNIYGVNRFD